MNIYKLISPVNKYNYVNHPYLKRDLDYYSQHYSDNTSASYSETNNDNEFDFMKRKKLSTTLHGFAYSDNYLIPKINVISNAMKVDIQDKTPLSKRLPEVMQNPYIPFGDPNTKYDELLTASPTMLNSVEPINYFGCRIVGDYLYNFDIGMIFKIIPKDFLARYIDPTMIKESTVYVDSRSAMIMPQKSAFKNIWIDTKRYIPIHPKYVETIDINSLIPNGSVSTVHQEQQPFGVNLNQQPISSYYTTPLPVEKPVEPVSTDYTTVREPERRESGFADYLQRKDDEEKKYQQQQQEKKTFDDIFKKMQPDVESDNTALEQQRKRRILDESLNEEQQQQPIRRRRKPKMNETK